MMFSTSSPADTCNPATPDSLRLTGGNSFATCRRSCLNACHNFYFHSFFQLVKDRPEVLAESPPIKREYWHLAIIGLRFNDFDRLCVQALITNALAPVFRRVMVFPRENTART